MIPGKRGDNVLKSPIKSGRGSKELNFRINNKVSIFCVHSWSVIVQCVHHHGASWHSINPGLTFQSGSSLESLMWWDHPPGGHGGRNNFGLQPRNIQCIFIKNGLKLKGSECRSVQGLLNSSYEEIIHPWRGGRHKMYIHGYIFRSDWRYIAHNLSQIR